MLKFLKQNEMTCTKWLILKHGCKLQPTKIPGSPCDIGPSIMPSKHNE